MTTDRWLVGQLPSAMLTDDFFVRFVALFQAEADTLMSHADSMPYLVDPTVAPPEMVRWLGSWIGVESIDAGLPVQRQREIVRASARTLALRGTARGLRAMLELLTGGPVEMIDGGGVFREGEAPADPARVLLRVATTGTLSESELVALVADEVPAHVRAELWVGGRRVWPTAEPAHPVPPTPRAASPVRREEGRDD